MPSKLKKLEKKKYRDHLKKMITKLKYIFCFLFSIKT